MGGELTQEENQQVNAMMRFFEAQVGNLAREGANAAFALEGALIKLRAAEARIAEFEKAAKPQDNVVQMSKEPA